MALGSGSLGSSALASRPPRGALTAVTLSKTVTETPSLRMAEARKLIVVESMVPKLNKLKPLAMVATPVSCNASLIIGHANFKTLTATPVAEQATVGSPKKAVSKFLKTTPITLSVTVRPQVQLSPFVVTVTETAMVNRKSKAKQPAQVLQLYDLIDPYMLPNLVGATVGYINNMTGSITLFDIYAAYVLAGGSFFVCDNGLKQALDQHPVLARVI